MKDKVKVVVLKPNDNPEVIEIENSLKAQQELVGGYIESYRFQDNIFIYVNEDGKVLKLPYNRPMGKYRFVGNIVFVKIDDNGNCIDLNDADIKAINEYLAIPF